MPITRRMFLSGTTVAATAAAVGFGAAPARAAGAAAPSAPWAGAGTFQLAYDPSVLDVTPAQYSYINDHTFIQDADGMWHLFGIFGPATTLGDPGNSDTEMTFAHATATSLTGPWTTQPAIGGPNAGLNPNDTHMWAPDVIEYDGTYYMFYAGGGTMSEADWGTMTINLSTSTDLYAWSPAVTLFSGGRVRDPCVVWYAAENQWIMYYTDVTETTYGAPGYNIVAARTSSDLVTWSDPQTVYTDPATSGNSVTESPFVVNRNGYWYLFIGPRGGYVGTDVFASSSPLSFDASDYSGHIPAHAVEVVNDGVQDWVSGAGEFELGVSLAPLHWQSFAPPWQSHDNPAVALDVLGRLNLFALDPTDNSILQCVQTDPASDVWGDWVTFGPPAGAVPTIGANLDGRLEVFSLGVDGANLTYCTQQADGSWGDWHSFGSAAGAAPTVSHEADGRISVFAIGPGGAYIAQREQTAPNTDTWTAWNAHFGGPCGGPPSVGINADGRMEVFAIGPARDYIAHIWQSTANGPWTADGWAATFGSACGGTPTVARDGEGLMMVHALAPAGAGIYMNPQAAPSSTWAGWSTVGVPDTWADAAPTLVANEDGHLEAFVLTPAGTALYYRWQQQATDGTWSWSDWEYFLGAPTQPCLFSATPSAVLDASGRINLFAVHADGSMWTTSQTSQNNDTSWGDWQPFGGMQTVAVVYPGAAT